MIIFKHAEQLSSYLLKLKKQGKKIAFVPTMGALHQGHISLLSKAKANDTVLVSSIFVNPTQFNDPKDFDKYPNTIENDITGLIQSDTDILFLPSVKEIYPDGTTHKKTFDLGYLETILEGSSRPGHFQGVCQVVERLLQIVQPDFLILGQKDYQQCMVITKLVTLMNLPTSILIGDTVREISGLAMSSRNMRLSIAEKEKATLIYKTLLDIKKQIQPGSLSELKHNAASSINAAGLLVDYIEIANAGTLEIIEQWNGSTKLVVLIAAYINGVRLIDNLLV